MWVFRIFLFVCLFVCFWLVSLYSRYLSIYLSNDYLLILPILSIYLVYLSIYLSVYLDTIDISIDKFILRCLARKRRWNRCLLRPCDVITGLR